MDEKRLEFIEGAANAFKTMMPKDYEGLDPQTLLDLVAEVRRLRAGITKIGAAARETAEAFDRYGGNDYKDAACEMDGVSFDLKALLDA